MSNDYGSLSTMTVADFICLAQLARILLSTEAQSLLLSTQKNGQYLPAWVSLPSFSLLNVLHGYGFKLC